MHETNVTNPHRVQVKGEKKLHIVDIEQKVALTVHKSECEA